MFGPDWWHHHGCKMKVKDFYPDRGCVKIEGSAAFLSVERYLYDDLNSCSLNEELELRFRIEWEVRYSLNEQTKGVIIVKKDVLKNMFGLPGAEPASIYGRWLLGRYKADSAEQGKYIRDGDYLNIPCPGTGHDGDPNISIEIDEEIREKIASILK